MAVTAKFQADFASFYSAVEKAEVELRGLETGAAKVEKSLNRMADSLSGRKLISDANLAAAAVEKIGGVTKLTEAEQAKLNRQLTEALAKYKALGIEAPASLQRLADETKGINTEVAKTAGGFTGITSSLGKMAGALGIAFSAAAVVNFGKQIFSTAGQIDDLSKKLGVSSESVQRWKYAAEQGGATIDTVGTAVSKMNDILASGGKSTVASLKQAGLSFEEIRRMSPESAFNAITEAISKIEDPMLRAKLAVDLFGRSGQDLLPAITAGIKKVGDETSVMSNDTVKRLADAEDAWGRLWTKVVVVSGEFIGRTLAMRDAVGKLTAEQNAHYQALARSGGVGPDGRNAEDFLRSTSLPRKDINLPVENPNKPKIFSPEDEAAQMKAEASAKKYAEALAEVNKKIGELRLGSSALSNEQKRSAEMYLKLGLSAGETALKIEATEVAVTQFKKEQDELSKILDKGAGFVNGLGDSYKYLGTQMTLTDGIVSTLMVSMPKVNDFLDGLSNLGTKMPKFELPPPPDATAWEKYFLGLSNESAEAARVSGVVWSESFYTTAANLRLLGSHFDNLFGDIIRGAAEAADAIGVMFDPRSSTLDKVMAGIDLAIELGKKAINLFRDEAHEATNDVRDDFLLTFGSSGTGIGSGFHTLAAQLHEEMGPAGDALFQRLINAKKVEDFNAVVAEIGPGLAAAFAARPENQAAAAGFKTIAELKAIAATAVKTFEYMRDSGLYTAEAVQQAWEKANGALIASGDEAAIAAKKASDFIQGLKTELQGLEASVANEAPEEVMGNIEREQRARIDAIKAELEAREQVITRERDARDDATDDTIRYLQQSLAETEFVARLKFDYELPEGLTVGAGSSPRGFSGGTQGQYLDFGAGTLAMLHGRERVMTESEGRNGSSGGTAILQVDGRTLAAAIVPHLPGEVRRYVPRR